MYFDTRLMTFHKDRFNFFDYDKIELVEDSGNYEDYADVVLFSKSNKNKEIKYKIYGLKITSV